MSAPRRGPLVAALGLALAAWVWTSRAVEERVVLVAVDADAFAALAGRTAAGAPELWERLKAMGVAAAVLREESVADLAARGDALHFPRAEVEKWRALGLVSPAAGPKPDSLTAKDAKAFARLTAALSARGVDYSTAAASGARALELPAGVDLSRVPAGFDPEAVAAVSSAGLIPIAASTSAVVPVAGQRLWVRTLTTSARSPEVRRAARGRARRLLVFRPASGLALEGNLERLRAALKTVKETGEPLVLPAATPETEDRARAARVSLFWLVGLLGPLLAARAGLQCQRAVRTLVLQRMPIAAPVPETVAGLLATWVAASAAGLLASALLPVAAREPLARAWTLWTLTAPLAVGAAALFSEGPSLAARWRAAVRWRDLATAALLALGLACLLTPRASLTAAGVWESVDRLSGAADVLWWWPWRWREILIGVPSLVLAFLLLDAREPGCETCGPKLLGDPRGWLALGLLAPAGAVAAVGAGGEPPLLAAAHGGAAFLLGGAIGFALAGLRARVETWAQRPTPTGLLT